MRIFLDVGAHVGETLSEVIKPQYRFDRIVAFEPSVACLPALEAIAATDPRIEIVRAGLSNRTATARLFQAGSEAGSVIGTLDSNPDHGSEVEQIELIETSEWLRANTAPGDLVVMKTNCEGSEVDIVENLLDTGMLDRLYSLLITFDIRMYPGGLAIERRLRQRLAANPMQRYCFSDDVMIGKSHEARIGHWLHLFGLDHAENDLTALKTKFSANFHAYSQKSGRFVRFEHWFKSTVSYTSFPAPIRSLLQAGKRLAGLNRERDTA
jgi:FkbM family methyltransferase